MAGVRARRRAASHMLPSGQHRLDLVGRVRGAVDAGQGLRSCAAFDRNDGSESTSRAAVLIVSTSASPAMARPTPHSWTAAAT